MSFPSIGQGPFVFQPRVASLDTYFGLAGFFSHIGTNQKQDTNPRAPQPSSQTPQPKPVVALPPSQPEANSQPSKPNPALATQPECSHETPNQKPAPRSPRAQTPQSAPQKAEPAPKISPRKSEPTLDHGPKASPKHQLTEAPQQLQPAHKAEPAPAPKLSPRKSEQAPDHAPKHSPRKSEQAPEHAPKASPPKPQTTETPQQPQPAHKPEPTPAPKLSPRKSEPAPEHAPKTSPPKPQPTETPQQPAPKPEPTQPTLQKPEPTQTHQIPQTPQTPQTLQTPQPAQPVPKASPPASPQPSLSGSHSATPEGSYVQKVTEALLAKVATPASPLAKVPTDSPKRTPTGSPSQSRSNSISTPPAAVVEIQKQGTNSRRNSAKWKLDQVAKEKVVQDREDGEKLKRQERVQEVVRKASTSNNPSVVVKKIQDEQKS